MTEKELKLELEAVLYSWGKSLLGDKSGGMINTLLRRKGLRGTHIILKMAAAKSDAREYIGGVLRDIAAKINDDVQIGTRMGNYEWTGSRWREIEETAISGRSSVPKT